MIDAIISAVVFICGFELWLTIIIITFWAAIEIDRDEWEENTKRIVPVHDMTGQESFIELDQEGENDEERYDF